MVNKVRRDVLVPTKKRNIRPLPSLTLSSDSLRPIKKQKTCGSSPSVNADIMDDDGEHNSVGGVDHISSNGCGLDIEKMRWIYGSPETEEDERRGISTKFVLYNDPWKITKQLTSSDLGNLSRLMVSKELIKKHVLVFFSEEDTEKVLNGGGKRVEVFDLDTNTQHYLILKQWSTSKCFLFNHGWVPDFVRRRNIKAGDLIGLCWDLYYSRFNFAVLNRADRA